MSTLEEVQPPDCYARAKELQSLLELLRLELGRPADTRPAVEVAEASPREVYFAALALFRKADRLSYEQTGDELFTPPALPTEKVLLPGHVLRVLDAAVDEVRGVAERFGLKDLPGAPARDASKTPSDVLGVVATTARQLNLLLEQPFSPGDVYQHLNLSIAYAEQLERSLGGDPDAVPEPAFEARKRPADVLRRLLEVLASLRGLYASSGLTMLRLVAGLDPAEHTGPGDVYDVASLVLAEFAHLQALSPDRTSPNLFTAHRMGRKLPSHCYQTAGHLLRHVEALAKLAEGKRGWARG